MENKWQVVVAVVVVAAIALLLLFTFVNFMTIGPGSPPAVVLVVIDSVRGQFLADHSGKPLYFYSGDSASVTDCGSQCMSREPYTVCGTLMLGEVPTTVALSNISSNYDKIRFYVSADLGTLNLASKPDSRCKQATYRGRPLYHDKSDSVDWILATPSASALKAG